MKIYIEGGAPKVFGIGKWMRKVTSSFARLSISQKISLFVLSFLLISFPLAVILVIYPKTFRYPSAGDVVISPNKTPVIITESMPAGVAGDLYSVDLTGYDANTDNDLRMRAVDLPTGLMLEGCVTVRNAVRVEITCRVQGVPEESGTHKVRVSLVDSQGAGILKEFDLTVR
jgi:hypothetical protein